MLESVPTKAISPGAGAACAFDPAANIMMGAAAIKICKHARTERMADMVIALRIARARPPRQERFRVGAPYRAIDSRSIDTAATDRAKLPYAPSCNYFLRRAVRWTADNFARSVQRQRSTRPQGISRRGFAAARALRRPHLSDWVRAGVGGGASAALPVT